MWKSWMANDFFNLFALLSFLKWKWLRFFNPMTVLARPILSWTKVEKTSPLGKKNIFLQLYKIW